LRLPSFPEGSFLFDYDKEHVPTLVIGAKRLEWKSTAQFKQLFI
jgi:hypothetical protein